MTIKTFQCFLCGIEVDRELKEYNRSIKKCGAAYCSKSCANKSRRRQPQKTKICKCGEEYSGLDRSRLCKDCKKIYNRNWYLSNKQVHVAQTKANRKRQWRERRIFLLKYLENHPCVDCGESDPVVLDFDHVRGKKLNNVSILARNNGWQVVLEEIKKCEVRCANCHRRKTAKQFNWYGLVA